MGKRILIDGAFREETRVALLENNILQSYDREDFSFKQLKGNIYLAKITKIEPSLQAAFVDYGGDKHGFLPFSDIHSDYFNIPQEEIKNLSEVKFMKNEENIEKIAEESKVAESIEAIEETEEKAVEESSTIEIPNYSADEEGADVDTVDEVDDNYDIHGKYKIEEVIKEGQYVLVQVLKEERGNKGVAMTTYISIAGKFCVLMINDGGRSGVSKKVINIKDRRILKSILRSLNVADNKSIILRTAGVGKKPEEILKDYLYLMRLWNTIRETTLTSKAPAFIHAEDDIIKRTIRDLYSDDVEEVIVEGAEAFKSVRGLIKLMSPNQVNQVKNWTEKMPLFNKFGIEDQLINLYDNKINLPSGGSIVIDQTEALVSIDVNSGRATKENNVEEMAVKTNVEAAREIARQLKLRDLAGLIVIDFIDMFELKNRRIVEREIKEAMMADRARIQIARLSIFGLLELSRQRLAASYTERVSEVCPRCKGKGKIKSKEIVAMAILRAIRYAVQDKQINVINVETTEELASYLLNFKRKYIDEIETDYDVHVFIDIDDNIKDNNYNLKKRKSLTNDEKYELDPKTKTGKVNMNIQDDDLYNVSASDIKKYKFDENIMDEGKNVKKVSKSKHKHNKPKNNKIVENKGIGNKATEKKVGWFKKILGL